jgi:hypothetical protein
MHLLSALKRFINGELHLIWFYKIHVIYAFNQREYFASFLFLITWLTHYILPPVERHLSYCADDSLSPDLLALIEKRVTPPYYD